MSNTPEFLRQYFWDIDFDKFDYRRYPRYVIERILEYGNVIVIRWMLKTFTQDQIISALEKSRELTPKSANFWALMLNVKEEKVKCLNMSFRTIRKQFWPY